MSYNGRGGPDPSILRWVLALLVIAAVCVGYLVYEAWASFPDATAVPDEAEIVLVD
jgi:hypothetical protein